MVIAVACLLLSVPVRPGFSRRLFVAVALGFASDTGAVVRGIAFRVIVNWHGQ
jgi:hypothetical protein